MEVTAPKPGNVHPRAAFDDVSYDDFVRSADVIAPVLANACASGVGRAIRDAVTATWQAVGTNTNLGMILLLAPLAAVPPRISLQTGIRQTLEGLSMQDARDCYAGIRLAAPGGLGAADQADVADEPQISLVEAMRLAADRDRVAAQYASNFADVLQQGLPRLKGLYDSKRWQQSVVRLQLELMASWPDSLIARKCGWDVARESQQRAGQVLTAGWPDAPDGDALLASFDAWLRADGHQRNPGTTADLVTAILFAGLREGLIPVPDEFAG